MSEVSPWEFAESVEAQLVVESQTYATGSGGNQVEADLPAGGTFELEVRARDCVATGKSHLMIDLPNELVVPVLRAAGLIKAPAVKLCARCDRFQSPFAELCGPCTFAKSREERGDV